MRSWRCMVFAALLTTSLGLASAGGLSPSLPPELTAEGQPRGDWQRVEGRLAQGRRSVLYALYVDPRYSAVYRVTRYRVTTVSVASDGREVSSDEPEVLIWNAHPGVRESLRGYVLRESGTDSGRWTSLTVGSDEYRQAMEDALSVYYGHNAAQPH